MVYIRKKKLSCVNELIILLNCGFIIGSDHDLITDGGFENALYMIDIGQNDIADSFAKNLSYVQVVKRIPSITTEIKNAIKVSKEIA